MTQHLCPNCENPLKAIDCSPCYDCGHLNSELQCLENDEHVYYAYTAFGQEIVLCDFCDADFASYNPKYFGLLDENPQGFLERVSELPNPKIESDLYCSECDRRLNFIQFRLKAIELNEKDK